ncbi:hypothetical protein Barb4_01175 [Bacteroidales bacterium Barb4]|nr:hypothetical protein Barb4_01175 [Bacteroidales bacterium Barb4]
MASTRRTDFQNPRTNFSLETYSLCEIPYICGVKLKSCLSACKGDALCFCAGFVEANVNIFIYPQKESTQKYVLISLFNK